MPAIAELKLIAERTRAARCLDCGKCTPTCPVAMQMPGFTPRRLIQDVMFEGDSKKLRACVSCGQCQTRCPSAVDFIEFVRQARAILAPMNGRVAHGGLFDRSEKLRLDRAGWIGEDLKVREQGEVLLFVGCAPLYDAFFTHLDVHTLNSPRAAIRVMNALGVEPVVLTDERCCGHDKLWSGDEAGFRTLAEHNVARIRAAGAKTVVTTCAECARCLGLDYPRAISGVGFEVMHFTQWLAGRDPSFGQRSGKVTFQDPCRLGRHLGDTASPRSLLGSIPGLEFAEMSRSGRDAVCCGTEGFSRCGAANKAVQAGRLADAASTGADTMLTACPKCMVHLSCARNDLSDGLPEIRDITEILAEAIQSGRTPARDREQ